MVPWCVVAAAAGAHCSPASLQTIDVPGASVTCATHINSKGLLTGLASSGTLQSSEAFLYDTVTKQFSFPKPIIPPGILLFTGLTRNRTVLVADLFLPGGTYLFHHGITTVQTGLAAQASGINDRGTLFGQTAVFPIGFLGFVLTPSGQVTMLNDGSNYVLPSGMDAAGRRVVGQSLNGGFAYKDGRFEVLQAPGATVGTYPYGVDGLGRISGTYVTGSDSAPVAHGFLYYKGAYSAWNVPGATSTQIDGENEAGQIVGCYTDVGGTHGFVATP